MFFGQSFHEEIFCSVFLVSNFSVVPKIQNGIGNILEFLKVGDKKVARTVFTIISGTTNKGRKDHGA